MLKNFGKLLFRTPIFKVKQFFKLVNLVSKNPTLKYGKNISVNHSKLGIYNFLGANSSLDFSHIGDYSYIGNGTKVRNTTIGKFSCIGPNVLIGLGEHPIETFVSVHPCFYSKAKQSGITFVEKNYFEEYPTKVEIGNDVWIGANVIITKSIKIGNGAVIAAGSIVTKDVDAFSIVGGVPAKKLKMRFDPKYIKVLENSKWWDKKQEWLKANINLMHDIQIFESSINKS